MTETGERPPAVAAPSDGLRPSHTSEAGITSMHRERDRSLAS